MERGKGILLPGQSSTSQRNTPANNEADISPVEPSNLQPEALLASSAQRMERGKGILLPGQGSTSQRNMSAINGADISPVEPSNLQPEALLASATQLMESGKGILGSGQSSTSQRNTPAINEADLSLVEPSNLQPEALLSSSAQLMERGKGILFPGQSSTSQRNTPATNEADLSPVEPSNFQPEALLSSSAQIMERGKGILLPGQSSTSQRNTPATNRANLSLVEPSNLQLGALLSSSESSDSEADSSSDGTSSSEETMVEKFKRKLSMYQEMLDETEAEQNPESTKKKKAENPLDDTYNRQMLLTQSISIIQNCFERATNEANLQGYVYGIILEDNGVLTGSSPSLRKWWEETVRFEHNGTAAADRYYMENQLSFKQQKDTETPKKTYDILMELSDATLASVLSALMNRCDPPQRKFPLEKKVPPPWWPTGNESWWDQITIENNQGLPPYRKPHDLRKMWKAAVVIAIIKHMAPDFSKLARVVKQSKNLQDRMSVREMHAWNYVLRDEAKIYSREHPDAVLSDLLGPLQTQGYVLSENNNSSGPHGGNDGFQPQLLQLPIEPQQQVPSLPPPQQQQQLQVAPMPSLPPQQRMLRYTCDHPRCLHHDSEFGFRTVELRDQHQLSCGFRNTMGQFGTPVTPFPSSNLYQEMMPPQFTPFLQATHTPFQQMAPRPLQATHTPFQQMAPPPFQQQMAPRPLEATHTPFQQMAPPPFQQQMAPPPFQQQMAPLPFQQQMARRPLQATHTPFQQMVPPSFQQPMVPQPPTAAYQQAPGAFSGTGPLQQAWTFNNNTGIPDYLAIPNDGQHTGLQSDILGGGFFNGDMSGGNAGSFM